MTWCRRRPPESRSRAHARLDSQRTTPCRSRSSSTQTTGPAWDLGLRASPPPPPGWCRPYDPTSSSYHPSSGPINRTANHPKPITTPGWHLTRNNCQTHPMTKLTDEPATGPAPISLQYPVSTSQQRYPRIGQLLPPPGELQNAVIWPTSRPQ